MDDRGRLAQPLTRSRPARLAAPAGAGGVVARGAPRPRIGSRPLPRGIGLAAAAGLMLSSIGYGLHRGEHLDDLAEALSEFRDGVANAAGFRIETVSLAGAKQVTREEVFAVAGVSPTTSLLFFDVEAARARLKSVPWIADATVRKLYPDRLEITVEERNAFALWQLQGKVSVIAADGTTVMAEASPSFARLPFVVGRGAETRAQAFLGVLDRFPSLRDQVRASILVAERRWNLRLKNGIDVRLPETQVEKALQRLADLDRDKKLLTRDIQWVDLRLPDRVTVRLSEAAAQAREETFKDKKSKRRAGDA